MPFDYEEHVKLMFDLLALAYQANITRVFTFMVAREVSNRTYPQVGVTDGHHAMSHHQNRPEKIEKNVKIQTYHIGLFADFLDKLDATPDGDGSLLDHSILLYGSNMSNSNAHDHFPLPNLVVGGGAGTLEGRPSPEVSGSHADDQPAVTLLDKAGVPVDTLGDSTGRIDELCDDLLIEGDDIAAFRSRPRLSRLAWSRLVDAATSRLVDAVKAGDSAAVASLLQQKVDVNAAEAGRHDGRCTGRSPATTSICVDRLICAPAPTSRPPTVTASRRCIWRALNGNAAMIEKLLKAGADANAARPEGETALMTVARTRQRRRGEGAARSTARTWTRARTGAARRR